MAEPYASACAGERGPFEDTGGQQGTLGDTTFSYKWVHESRKNNLRHLCKKIVSTAWKVSTE